MQLTKTFSGDQYAQALESWAWVGVVGKAPMLASLFGDLFLQDDQGCWYLDTVEGRLQLLWSDAVELHAVLDTAEGQDRYLLAGLALAAEGQGIVLGPDSIYDFTIAPVLGGALDPANISAIDFVVGLNLAGQIHEQVRGRAPGTKISAAMITDTAAAKRHKFWPRSR